MHDACHPCEQARAALQDLTRQAVAKEKTSVPNGKPSDLAEYLADTLAAEQFSHTKTASAGCKSVNVWLTEDAASTTQSWIKSNNSSAVNSQASFVNAVTRASKNMGISESGRDDQRSIGLSDLLWTCADAIFKNIPPAVPSFATAAKSKRDGYGSCCIAELMQLPVR